MAGGLFVFTEQKKLVSMRAAEFATEDDFQRLLAENPTLLSGEQNNTKSARRWMLVAREKGIPAEQGGRVMVGCRPSVPRSGRHSDLRGGEATE